jgi:hypothetical protein
MGIAMAYRQGGRRIVVRFSVGRRDFSLFHIVNPGFTQQLHVNAGIVGLSHDADVSFMLQTRAARLDMFLFCASRLRHQYSRNRRKYLPHWTTSCHELEKM